MLHLLPKSTDRAAAQVPLPRHVPANPAVPVCKNFVVVYYSLEGRAI
jgi:hypothetical protein